MASGYAWGAPTRPPGGLNIPSRPPANALPRSLAKTPYSSSLVASAPVAPEFRHRKWWICITEALWDVFDRVAPNRRSRAQALWAPTCAEGAQNTDVELAASPGYVRGNYVSGMPIE